jgi:phosphoglycolate phosphatase
VGDVRRLIAFDLDGTLVDSRRDLADSANALIVELGGRPLSEEQIGGMVGEGARLLVQRALAAAGIGDVSGALERFLTLYDQRLLNHTRLYPGMADVVRAAHTHARLAVLTNKPVAPSGRILEALGVGGLFAEVIGGDGDYPRKPDPAALLALIERAGASRATTLLVGDSVIDYETAQRAGVRCCIVTYGFGRWRPGQLKADDWLVDDAPAVGATIQQWVSA